MQVQVQVRIRVPAVRLQAQVDWVRQSRVRLQTPGPRRAYMVKQGLDKAKHGKKMIYACTTFGFSKAMPVLNRRNELDSRHEPL